MGTGWSQDEAPQIGEESGKTNQTTSQSSGVDSKAAALNGTTTQVKLPHSAEADNIKEATVPGAATTEQVKLPHNYEAIIKDADSAIDKSSVNKLYHQLTAGVYLHQKNKKYWVERKSNSNCFMLFARNLSITWAEDIRYWHWPLLKETSSDEFIDVAELLAVCWLEIHGNFNTTQLSPGIKYKVVFVLMLKDSAYGWEVPVNLRLTLPNGNTQQHEENLMKKPRAQWIEIPAGEFQTSPENIGDIQFSLYEYTGGKWKRGLVITGVVIRPKNN